MKKKYFKPAIYLCSGSADVNAATKNCRTGSVAVLPCENGTGPGECGSGSTVSA